MCVSHSPFNMINQFSNVMLYDGLIVFYLNSALHTSFFYKNNTSGNFKRIYGIKITWYFLCNVVSGL